MAEQTRGLEILLRSLLDPKGFDDLKARLAAATADVKEHADADKDASDRSKEFGDSLSKMGEQMAEAAGEILAGKEALGFFKESIGEAIQAQKELTQFAAANEALGKATAGEREENEKWLQSMEVSSGFTKSELVPAYMKLVGATGDVTKAQALSQIAAGAAAQGFGDLGENATMLARFLLNPDGPVRGTSALAIQIKEMQKAGVPAAEVMKTLSTRFADAGANVNTAAMQVARGKVEWSEFKESVGSLALSLVQYLKPALELAGMAITAIIVGAQKLAGYLGVLGGSFYGFFRAVGEAMSGHFDVAKAYFKGTIAEIKDGLKQVNADADKTAEKLTSAFNMSSTGILNTSKVTAAGIAAITKNVKAQAESLDQVLKRVEMQAKLSGQGQEDELKKLIDGLNKVKATYKLSADERLKIDVLIKESMTKLNDLEVAEIARTDKVRDASEKKRLASEQQIWTKKLQAQEKALKTTSKNDVDYYQKLIALYQADLADYTLTAEEKEKVAEKLQAAQAELDAKTAKANADMNNEIMNNAITTLGNAFGLGKEISIANAIINTYEGATKALAQGGILGEVMAAIVIATGLAQIATIESTTPASGGSFSALSSSGSVGFDDPSNDFAAYVGGQRWARDMTDKFTAGATSGFASQMVSQDNRKTYNNNTTNQGARVNQNVHVSGLMDSGDRVMMNRFVRKLQVAQTYEAQRTPR